MVSIKDVVRSSVKVPEFDKHLKKAGGHIGRNVVEITIKMKTIVRKILMIKRTLSSCYHSGQSRPRSDGNEGVICIRQGFRFTGASPSDCLVPYLGHLLEESYPSVEKLSVYSTAPTDWAPEDMKANDEKYIMTEIFNPSGQSGESEVSDE